MSVVFCQVEVSATSQGPLRGYRVKREREKTKKKKDFPYDNCVHLLAKIVKKKKRIIMHVMENIKFVNAQPANQIYYFKMKTV